MKNTLKRLSGLLIAAFIIPLLFCCIKATAVSCESVSLQDADTALLNAYVECVNSHSYMRIPELFEEEEKAALTHILEQPESQTNYVGVYNVSGISNIDITEVSNRYMVVDYPDFDDIKSYLVRMDCNVHHSNEFFKEGINFFFVVAGTENEKRVLLEMSVAPDTVIAETIQNNSTASVSQHGSSGNLYEKYKMERDKVLSDCFSSMTGTYSTLVYAEGELSVQVNFSPFNLPNYVMPSTIVVHNKITGQNITKDFRRYCYVVSSAEFSVGTKGKQRPM